MRAKGEECIIGEGEREIRLCYFNTLKGRVVEGGIVEDSDQLIHIACADTSTIPVSNSTLNAKVQ
jgi:hypothetical protein